MKVDVSKLVQFGEHLVAAKKQIEPSLRKVMAEVGPETTSNMKRVLPEQTGLKFKTINKALRGRLRGAGYEIYSKGGDIRLKFFTARETSKGVTAAPWNSRRLYPATFIKSGWWPKRGKPVSGGNVMKRVGKSKFPIVQVRSGLFIPDEMVKGKSAIMFYGTVEARFAPAIEKIILATL